ncbi:MAG: dodecin domain-containing protein [Anaerolineae bacterium]|nr:dodecin domain-containing protein [Anaerolineae bacterium]
MARIAKVIEINGTSPDSWQVAAENALTEAQQAIHHISGIEVSQMTANVCDGRVMAYRTTLKIAFAVERAEG